MDKNITNLRLVIKNLFFIIYVTIGIIIEEEKHIKKIRQYLMKKMVMLCFQEQI